MIKGIVQAIKTNDYGFTSIKVSNEWYGSDQKGKRPPVAEGDLIEFEAAPNAKGYMTLKKGTLAKLEKTQAAVAALPAPKANERDTYWQDKAKADEAKEPVIRYFAAFERAVLAADFYVRNGALSLDKVKAADKLAILREFVDLETARVLALATGGTKAAVEVAEAANDAEVAAPAKAAAVEESAGW